MSELIVVEIMAGLQTRARHMHISSLTITLKPSTEIGKKNLDWPCPVLLACKKEPS